MFRKRITLFFCVLGVMVCVATIIPASSAVAQSNDVVTDVIRLEIIQTLLRQVDELRQKLAVLIEKQGVRNRCDATARYCEVALSEGESVLFNTLRIKIYEIRDNRCPVNHKCLVASEVVFDLSFATEDTEERTLLSSADELVDFGDGYVFEDYRIQFSEMGTSAVGWSGDVARFKLEKL